jgi:arylsulfatase A-like enzyme/thioredoxin-like negative regulator of GroEL
MTRPLVWLRSAVGLFALALALAGCFSEAPPNVVLVTFDTTRYDRLGCDGDSQAKTPTLDALAARGLLFEHAYASVALTLPSHTTMLTGRDPIAHGVHDNMKYRVPDELTTLAEIFRDARYQTGAFVSALVLGEQFNLSQGFEVYGDRTSRTSRLGGVPQRQAAETADQAIAWLDAREPGRPFFLWTHFYDPHLPRKIEPPFDAIADPYRAEIAYADAQLARVLEALERTAAGRPTWIVFTADHGESLGEHGELTHGLVAYDATLHVPLILVGPGAPRGERSKRFARHVDLVPTLLAAAGLPVPEGLPGRDLLRAAADTAVAEDESVGWFESYGSTGLGWAAIEGVRTARWKYTAAPAPEELYDILKDPGETSNLAAEEPEERARLAAIFSALRAAPPNARESRREDIGLEEREQLAALGYIEAPARFDKGQEPDPRRFVAVHGWVEQARQAAFNGEYQHAIELLETLAESPSVQALVLRSLGRIYEEAGRADDAIRSYRRFIKLTGSTEARLGLARVQLRSGRPRMALTALRSLPSRDPSVAPLRALALARLGRLVAARKTLDESFAGERRLRQRSNLVLLDAPVPDGESELRGLLAEAPADALLKSRLGYYLAVWGSETHKQEALGLLREAAASEAKEVEIQSNLGWGAYRRGEPLEAIRGLEAALALDPSRPMDQYRLAQAFERSGDPQRALEQVSAALRESPGAYWSPDAKALRSLLESELRARAQKEAS